MALERRPVTTAENDTRWPSRGLGSGPQACVEAGETPSRARDFRLPPGPKGGCWAVALGMGVSACPCPPGPVGLCEPQVQAEEAQLQELGRGLAGRPEGEPRPAPRRPCPHAEWAGLPPKLSREEQGRGWRAPPRGPPLADGPSRAPIPEVWGSESVEVGGTEGRGRQARTAAGWAFRPPERLRGGD